MSRRRAPWDGIDGPLSSKSAAGDIANDAVRPVVRLPRGGLSGAALVLVAIAAALLLFSVLEARRRAPTEPATRPRAADEIGAIAEPPPLFIPPAPAVAPAVASAPAGPSMPPAPPTMRQQPPPPQQAYGMTYSPPLVPQAPPALAPSTPLAAPPSRNSTTSALVIDTTVAPAAAPAAGLDPRGQAVGLPGAVAAGGRARSSMLANRSSTVSQGTVIPAVLETAFDSTRPGFARAIVSRDIRGFDGDKVLIQRGSRLVGEYRSEVAPGQKRAVITWTRLVRPDGTTIALDSPAVDPLGRGGVKASVNNHVPQRVVDALLQSTFQLGSVLASRVASGSVAVVLPNSLQGSIAPQGAATITPTLRVPAGSSISIFVSRDLEFSAETHD